jgi:hypothetical protein
MRTVHVVAPPLGDQNIRAFFAPLLSNLDLLATAGIRLKIFTNLTDDVAECDTLMLTSSYWRGEWTNRRCEALPVIARLASRVPVLFFDRTSTAGTVIADVLPLVQRYYKTSLLRDRSLYTRPLYGRRQFTDYYHRQFGVTDDNPVKSTAVDPALLDRLRLSWNTGLANYGPFGPRLSAMYRMLPLSILMRPSRRAKSPSANRPIDVSCRMGTRYKYESVAFQRRRVADILSAYRRVKRISKLRYFQELRQSKVVLSPFGYSEINYKDFETFLCGALLIKPDMSHLETFPPLYEDGVTYVAHRWDLSDLETLVQRILDQYDDYIRIARQGQERYRWHTTAPGAAERFVAHFIDILEEAK